MSAVDTLIGAGAVIAGGAIGYLGSSRDRQQRRIDAREDRDHADRREACLLLERQRGRQLEIAEAQMTHYKIGAELNGIGDDTDIQNPDVDAMVSIFLPDRIEKQVEEINGLWNAFLSSCGAVERAEDGQPRIDAYKGMTKAFERLKEGSLKLRQSLRDEARSK